MANKSTQDIYAAVKKIPPGKVATYGQIAMLAGRPRAARMAGRALHNNNEPGVVPCHRVVFHDGALATEFAFGGAGVQRQMLESEGICFLKNGKIDMKKCQWQNNEK